ncbi:MAG: DUF1127 domain-containing protein [Pseudomonadota bacterium]
MAFYENTRASERGARVEGSVLNRIAAAVAHWNETRKTRAALTRLSDRELEDIGLTRGDVDRL